MTLNKDLFGDVIPEKPEGVPVGNPRKPVPHLEGMPVFHGSSLEPPEEFTKAPVLHVGTADQAANIVNPDWRYKEHDDGFPLYDNAEDVENVHPLYMSKHAKIHPVTVPDDIANEAHWHFLTERGHVPSNTVEGSRSFHGVNHPLVKTALNALRQNKIVSYVNDVETPKDLYEGADVGDPHLERALRNSSLSYMVPAPHINLVQFGQKEPVSQPLLPMDYTGVLPPSKRTLRHREIKKEYPWASNGAIQVGRYDI